MPFFFAQGWKLTFASANRQSGKAINGYLMGQTRMMAANKLANDQAVVSLPLTDVMRETIKPPDTCRQKSKS